MVRTKKIALLIALSFACAPAFPQAASDQTAAVTSALRARDFDKAVELSQSALQKSPNDPRLWTLQGMALANQGDTKKALVAFERALKISPNYVAALEGAAQINYQSGSRDAVPQLTRLLQLRPGDPTASAMLAVLEYREGNCASATRHFERAGELLDSQLDALHAYATCLVRLKKLGEAEKVFQHIVSLHPELPQERSLLAAIQVMAHKPQDAINTLTPLLDANVQDAPTLELASTAYEDVKDTPHAVSTLRQALLLDPKNINLYLDFANICYAHQSFQVGVDVMTEGIALQPSAAPLYLARGVLFVQMSDYEKAEVDFEKSHELDPNQSLSSAAQSMAAVQANDLDRALATIQEKLAKKPDDAFLLYLQADILTQKGSDPGTPEFQDAMRSAKKAVALQPTLGAARGVLAKLYLQSGQYQDAIDQCRKALASDPKDQTALYHLIQALRKTGQKDELPDLLKRLAQLREQATNEERERFRYKLIEGEPQPAAAAQPKPEP
jgi:tetratricopeptide (TPR) repeat protein